MSINIGPITLADPVILAPMSGVTDLPFRRLVRSFGAGLVVSEMIASHAMVLQTRQSMKLSTGCAEEFPMAVQLAGCDPAIMAEAALLNVDRGAAIIDINFGCPVKKIVRKYAGSAIMRDEALAVSIMEAVVKAVPVPVTMKMRTGWDDTNRNAPQLARLAEESGISMVTVHGRTRCQLYNGSADWRFIRNVKAATSLPVIANGDIKTLTDVQTCLEESGADGVMIGRGACGKPWFLRQVADHLAGRPVSSEPSIAQQSALVVAHYREILQHYGERVGVRLSRKHLSWYGGGLPGAATFRAEVNGSDDPTQVIDTIHRHYDQARLREAA